MTLNSTCMRIVEYTNIALVSRILSMCSWQKHLKLFLQDGSKPIHLASSLGYLQIIRTLIRMGSNPTVCTEDEVHQTILLIITNNELISPLHR